MKNIEHIQNNQMHKDEGLWELCNEIWNNATDYKEEIEKYYAYFNGKFKRDAAIYETFNKETHTPFNYIKPIINTKICFALSTDHVRFVKLIWAR